MLRVVAVLIVLSGTTARADVFDHARDDYAAAGALFSRSLQLNYADCVEQTNQLRRAYELFGEVQPRARERGQLEPAQLARDRSKALELRLATLTPTHNALALSGAF